MFCYFTCYINYGITSTRVAVRPKADAHWLISLTLSPPSLRYRVQSRFLELERPNNLNISVSLFQTMLTEAFGGLQQTATTEKTALTHLRHLKRYVRHKLANISHLLGPFDILQY